MLAISNIWMCLFLNNSSILTKSPILGQAPSQCSILADMFTIAEQLLYSKHVMILICRNIFLDQLRGIVVFWLNCWNV